MSNSREIIAKRIALMFKEGDLVNLGIGMPTAVANYLPKNVNIVLHSENGFVGIGPSPASEESDLDIINAGGKPVTILPGGACFDSAMSFSIIRGGHLAATVLGALQVDEHGNLANWIIPGKLIPGMGGAMDLVVGAKKVIIAMEHTAKDGSPKILKQCTLPLTASKEVNYIVTELAFMEITNEGIVLREISPYTTINEVLEKTEANLIIPEDLVPMAI